MSDEEQVRTNIVPVGPQPEEQPTQEEAPEDQPVTVTEEISYAHKLANDAILFMVEEFKNDTDNEFWEVIRDECNKRLGLVPVDVAPMTPEQFKSFSKEEIPWGKYAGTRVATVAKKDRAALEKLSTQPLPFQTRLQKWLATKG